MERFIFDDLQALVTILPDEQLRNARKFLTLHNSNLNGRKPRSLRLFDYVRSRPGVPRERAHRIVGPGTDLRSFNRLCYRVYHKVLDYILTKPYVNGKPGLSLPTQAQIEARKLLLQAYIVKGLGQDVQAFRLLDRAIRLATRYELYSELNEALHHRMWNASLTEDDASYHKTRREVAKCGAALNAQLRAQTLYYEYTRKTAWSATRQIALDFLISAITELMDLYGKTKASVAGLYLYFMQGEFHLRTDEATQALRCFHKCVELVHTRPALQSRPIRGNAYNELADAEMQLHRFGDSIIHLELAAEYYHPTAYNNLLVAEKMAQNYAYLGHLDRAVEYITDSLRQTDRTLYTNHYSRRSFLYACTLFLQGEYKASKAALRQSHDIEHDREGWNIGIRVMGILNSIELRHLDTAGHQLEALRKHTSRLASHEVLRPRDRLIIRVLRILDFCSYDFRLASEQAATMLELLKGDDPIYRWQPKTWEMLVFEEWFAARAAREAYIFTAPQWRPDPEAQAAAEDNPMPKAS